jgi:hypothetical protein
MSDIIEPPKGFKATRFWKDCNNCRGFGEVPAHDKYAGNNTSGEIVAEAHKSYCLKCKGSGISLKQ